MDNFDQVQNSLFVLIYSVVVKLELNKKSLEEIFEGSSDSGFMKRVSEHCTKDLKDTKCCTIIKVLKRP